MLKIRNRYIYSLINTNQTFTNMLFFKELSLYLVFIILVACHLKAQALKNTVDFKHFLSKHDMIWDEVPNNWETAPYTGNGNVGFLFYKTKGESKNTMSLNIGRHDYSDHKEAKKTDQMLWIKRSRLPLGYFNLTSKEAVI